MLEFIHRFEEDPPLSDLSIDTGPSGSEKISISIEEGDKIWLSANRAGWLHLARICAELGIRQLEPGYHFHQDFNFKDSYGHGPEISFEVID